MRGTSTIYIENDDVHFKVRDRENPVEKKVMVLKAKEFMRRFLLHVLPKHYVRIRHFGLLGSRLKKLKIAIVRQIQGVIAKVKLATQDSWQEVLKRVTGIDADLCPSCKSGNLRKLLRLPSILGPPALA